MGRYRRQDESLSLETRVALNMDSAGTPENGLEQFYTFADALAMASWLNVFVRQADIVEIACIAQSVNVISPLITR